MICRDIRVTEGDIRECERLKLESLQLLSGDDLMQLKERAKKRGGNN
jgi:hypothetical protein